MQVTYQNRFWDFLWFNFYQIPRARSTQISFAISYLFLLWIGVDIARRIQVSLVARAIIVVGVAAIAALVLLAFHLVFVLLNLLTNPPKGRTITKVSASENGSTVESRFGRSETKWTGIAGVKQSRSYILFYFSDRMALLIPKRAFASREEASRFFGYAHDSWTKVKHQTYDTVVMSE